jgi:uncharacterized membrane protein
MNGLPLHPLVVHIPIALSVLLPPLALAVLMAWKLEYMNPRTWHLVVALQAVLLIGGLAASRTGEADEEMVEEIVAHEDIEEHEERAEAFLIASGVTLVVALASSLLLRRRQAWAIAVVATVLMAGVMVLGVRTGHAGGQLVYVHGAASAHIEGGDPKARPPPSDHHDQD